MKLTPLDIQQMAFRVRFRGYDRAEVDRFLEDLAATVEHQNREVTMLRDKLSSSEAHLAELKKTESTLSHTLLSTQALADELKQIATRDAELIMKEAELKASELLRDARGELATLQRELTDLQKQRLLAIERLRSMLRTFERMLEVEESDRQYPARDSRAEEITG